MSRLARNVVAVAIAAMICLRLLPVPIAPLTVGGFLGGEVGFSLSTAVHGASPIIPTASDNPALGSACQLFNVCIGDRLQIDMQLCAYLG